tara:strand:+ start:453 stop:725 length:273 start_codon:yes stop_codon:yes gene_type:complete
MEGYRDYMVRRMNEEQNKTGDAVNHPPHYNVSGIECIDALKAMLGDEFQAYLQGNIAKYLWRYRYKNGVEDLKKAQWYLNKLIEVYDDKS